MIRALIRFFVSRHLLTNILCVAVLVAGVFCWRILKKEELPDVTFDTVRVSARYPGATATETEHFLTRELEQAVQGIDGVYRVISAVSQGSTTVSVELDPRYPDKNEAIADIRQAVLAVPLPADVRDLPTVRVFKTSRKAILDIALVDTTAHVLDVTGRRRLQQYALALENRLLNMPEVNAVNRSGYLREEIQINVDPQQLRDYRIPLNTVITAVQRNHARQPAGNLEAPNEPKVTLAALLDTPELVRATPVQAGFEGAVITVADVAQVERGFERSKEIIKVNGHEAVILTIVKNSSHDILTALDAVRRQTAQFQQQQLRDSPINIVCMDDESIDVRNRLSIIGLNGGLGFALVVLMLFLFLNKRSALWVSLGIPFSLCFTLVGATLLGFSINNTTLAAVIIVLGIVVDDAIVIAENITRCRSGGMGRTAAAVEGTVQVFLPVLASVLTTAIAFVPLMFFSGRYGKFNSFIPPVVIMMLSASLFESLFILPGHMNVDFDAMRRRRAASPTAAVKRHWFERVEAGYIRVVQTVLPWRYLVFAVFIALLLFAVGIMRSSLRFVMFPDEETREIVISGEAAADADRLTTAAVTRQLEAIVQQQSGPDIVGVRTDIARSRRGGAAEEHRFRMLVEVVPRDQRRDSADELVALWRPAMEAVPGLVRFTVQKSRWGQSGGSAIEVAVQDNNDQWRKAAAERLAAAMRALPELTAVEIEAPVSVLEYSLDFKRQSIKQLSINAADIRATLRAALQGTVLYELPQGTEQIDVRLSLLPAAKTDIESILAIPVENNQNYLVPLADVLTVRKTITPNTISRRDQKRVTTVLADLKPGARATPLEIAARLEQEVFPAIAAEHPSTTFAFLGEIFDTREAQTNLRNAIWLALLLIYAILTVSFNSLTRPLIIMLAIPFGLVGVVLTFWAHGKTLFGLFAAIGCLGLAGVVVNDAIVMISRLQAADAERGNRSLNEHIAAVAGTRLRAIILTTVTTVAGVMPTAYGVAGYDATLAEMMLALAWGLLFGTLITLVLVPCLYRALFDARRLTAEPVPAAAVAT